LPRIFHWANYTITKLSPYRGKKPKMEGKLESKIGGENLSPKTGGKLCPIVIPDLGG